MKIGVTSSMRVVNRIEALLLVLLVATALPVFAQTPATVPSSDELNYFRPLQRRLETLLELPAALPIDAQLRDQATALAREALDQSPSLFRGWLAEERAVKRPGATISELSRHLFARFANEVALWSLDSAGPAYDASLLPALRDAQHCRPQGQVGLFSARALLWQRLDGQQRAIVLDGERTLLQRWGKPRQALAPRPVPHAQEESEQAIFALKSGGKRPAMALPPILALRLLSQDLDVEKLTDAERCALVQWWLRLNMPEGESATPEVLSSFRYAAMPTASRLLPRTAPMAGAASAPSADYPEFARLWEVVGSVTMQMSLNASGQVLAAQVVEREIRVPGVRGVRPVAFESLFDAASVARVRRATHAQPAETELNAGVAVRREMVDWRLE